MSTVPYAEIVNGVVRSIHWYSHQPVVSGEILLLQVDPNNLPDIGVKYLGEGNFERLYITIGQRLGEIRDVRNRRIEEVRWAIQRHRDQVELGVRTTLSDEQYRQVLAYVDALRNITEVLDYDAEFTGIADLPWPTLDVNTINKVLYRPSGTFVNITE
jgi:hypothetical protein